jgi:predicted aspartyl protease
MRRLAPLVALLTAAACATVNVAAPPLTELPLERQSDGRLILQVLVDGAGPYPFVLDTGASVTILDPTLLDELSLAPAGYDVVVHGVTGSASAPAYAGVALGLGDDVISPSFVVAMDLTHLRTARGVLGMDVLRKRVVEIDGDLEVIRLGRVAYTPPQSGVVVTRAKLVVDVHGLPHVLVTVNNAEGLALVDTGLGGMIIDPSFATRARVPMTQGPLNLVDVMSEEAAAPRSGRALLRIGRARWTVNRIALLRPAVLDQLDAGAPTEAILGADVFSETTLVLDFESGDVYIIHREA